MIADTHFVFLSFQKMMKILHFFILSTPLTKYCFFRCLIWSIFAPKCAQHHFQKWRSRARGVANIENGIPMLHGKRFFCDPRAAWECEFRFFQHPCGETGRKSGILKTIHMILQIWPVWLSTRSSLFWVVSGNVIPTERGDYIFKLNSREVNCCDAEMKQYLGETKQKHILHGIYQRAGCV